MRKTYRLKGQRSDPANLAQPESSTSSMTASKSPQPHWKPGKGETKHQGEEGATEVPFVYDAESLWDQAHAAGKREEFAEQYEAEAEYYRQHLDKLCDEISKDPGDTEAAIKMVSEVSCHTAPYIFADYKLSEV